MGLYLKCYKVSDDIKLCRAVAGEEVDVLHAKVS